MFYMIEYNLIINVAPAYQVPAKKGLYTNLKM